MQPPQPPPFQQPTTQQGVVDEPLSLKDTIMKYYHEGRRDMELHHARSLQEKAAYTQLKAQSSAARAGEVPEYFVYGIGAQQTPITIPPGQAPGNPMPVPPHPVYQPVFFIGDIHIPLDPQGLPAIGRLSIRYDPITRSYRGSVIDNPEVCNVPGSNGHSLVVLPRTVQFHAKDIQDRDIPFYSNIYCRACGYHQLRLMP
eukprot:gnl/Chilomastix_caulleri/1722.p1 GENE.gnl/Chilomastix_caulleri/1722~~gnl/Chilomastix_caulleri/1722.p1  ORF type:complete len:232 (-),score=57.52 gnl/Chilomastix_caulleri/1722:27-626(-)